MRLSVGVFPECDHIRPLMFAMFGMRASPTKTVADVIHRPSPATEDADRVGRSVGARSEGPDPQDTCRTLLRVMSAKFGIIATNFGSFIENFGFVLASHSSITPEVTSNAPEKR